MKYHPNQISYYHYSLDIFCDQRVYAIIPYGPQYQNQLIIDDLYVTDNLRWATVKFIIILM